MKAPLPFWIPTGSAVIIAALTHVCAALSCQHARAQTLTPEFVTAGYSLLDLGSITDLPTPYGGLTIRADQPNTLYIGGSANAANGAIYSVPLIRDGVTNQITGFGGPAVFHSTGPNNDGGLTFTPSGTLLFTQYTPFTLNSMGQILPDNTYVTTQLTSLGVSPSIGSHAFVPNGYPGAGGLVIASYNASIVYRVPFTVDGTGLHEFFAPTASIDVAGTATGPEGIAYVPLGSAGFPAPSMVVSAYGMNKVVVFEVGTDGLPNTATVRDMVTGLTGAEGAWIDPVTGDFLFSTFGGSNRVIRVSGFELPTAISETPLPRATVRVSPNPTDGLLRLSLYAAQRIEAVEVIDARGCLALRMGRPADNTIDLGALHAGVYTLMVLTDDGIRTARVVRE
ncbi:MAG TPA: T9SS type A sorting domain-containing protein [Flavobacteriales bacterium]|nr:T9SS type A sorting domain-containing protein [Flavobacteriales bacterium]